MEGYDPEMAARVWQRVRPEGMQVRTEDDLAALIGRVQMDGAVYLSLSRQLGAKLKKLAEAKRSQALCLMGVYTMATGQRTAATHLQPPKATHQTALRRCFASELHTLSQYELRTADSQFGSIYAQLAKEQRMCCRMIAEVIGSAER